MDACVALFPDQRLVPAAVHAQSHTVDFDHLDHSPAGGKGDEGVGLPHVLHGKPVGVRVGIAEIHGLEAQTDTCLRKRPCRVRQPLVVRVPA